MPLSPKTSYLHSAIPFSDGIISLKLEKEEVRFSCSYGIADINSDPSDDLEDKVLLLVESAEELEK